MVKYVFLIFLLISSCTNNYYNYDPIKLGKYKVKNGTIEFSNSVRIKNNLFISKTEVSNLEYLEYLHYIKDSTEEYFSLQLPDTMVWTSHDLNINSAFSSESEPFIDHYLRNPGYGYSPVVGISFDQANRFCKWLTDIWTEKVNSPEFRKKLKSLKKYHLKLTYRLPSISEWELAAIANMDTTVHKYGTLTGKRKNRSLLKDYNRKCFKFYDEKSAKYDLSCKIINKPQFDSLGLTYHPNIIVNLVEFNVHDHFYLDDNIKKTYQCKGLRKMPSGVKSNTPNNFGIYNLIGNMAEMTNTKNISKGGSFNNRLQNISIGKNTTYEKPSVDLGFRYVIEVTLEEK
ncbi:formylglycine-generating enzyme family protein [Flexithrix dorotheae]|uniref:formylglycine-generating enzyme family protein n=1 Tax=Flexithrix dorotheae TaxID=70993 RepID=UPI00037E0C90|nr:SUMF1/EgtB/PvdO family nonheme iron enzyme [Flexithrix dorotheae]